ncbi:MAG: hypothetical protein ACP6IY_09625 [Promethearchaeia archaeon]
MTEKSLFVMPKRVEFLLILSKTKIKKPYSFSDFERELGYKLPRTDLRNVLKCLINNNVLTLIDTIGGFNRYKLNYRKLNQFIQKLEIYNYFFNYIDNKFTVITL